MRLEEKFSREGKRGWCVGDEESKGLEVREGEWGRPEGVHRCCVWMPAVTAL